ncbi:oxidoreductase [Streptomyces sp. NBC_01216]|uniref:oxidoreductase n=1 Tax=unclassified Streptomyces TaxID=2593676 RepID=UPI002E100D7A|nr:oxidoreductase [Streptomyces sp. NBC_01216]
MSWSLAHVPDQSGRTVLVTGASGGIGLETSRVFAARGAHVVLACRSVERGQVAASRIAGSTEVVRLDLVSLDSVREAAAEVRGRHGRLDLLINNAGVMFPEYRRTADGFEAHFGVNHLGHFALTGLLLDLMTAVPGSRVVTVASLAHRVGWGGFDADLAKSATGRRSATAYGRSKLANLLFARELQHRLAVAGAATVSVAAHPGLSPTGLWHGDPPPLLRPVAAAGLRWLAQPAEQAAWPSLRAATDPRVAGGSYLGPRQRFESRGTPVPARSSRASRDEAARARLWDLSQELTGVRYEVRPERLPESPVSVCPVTGVRA